MYLLDVNVQGLMGGAYLRYLFSCGNSGGLLCHPSLNTGFHSDHVLTHPFLQLFHRNSLCLGGSRINND